MNFTDNLLQTVVLMVSMVACLWVIILFGELVNWLDRRKEKKK